MAGNNGNNGNNGNKFNDLMIEDVKALFPGMTNTPLATINTDNGNPGIRLVDNSDNLAEMLKVVWFPDIEMARNVAEALAECDEFLIEPDGKTRNKEVLQRIEWVKNLCASLCSYNARFADLYKQAAIGVATTAVTEKGATLITFPGNIPSGKYDSVNNNKNVSDNHGRKA